jgi:pteridine reductase
MDLPGRVALVTGAGHRLGRAIAVGLARSGCDVAVHYHTAAGAAEVTIGAVREAGRRAEGFAADLRRSDAARALPERVRTTFGRLDVVVNSAGVMARRALDEITPEDWDGALAVNLSAAFYIAQAAAPELRRVRGKIVNLADVAAFEVWPSYLPLNVSKAALVMLTHGLARVLAPEVTVNAVAPGAVLPPEDWPAEARAHLAATTPLGRLGSPDDVVRAVLFLLEQDYVTGAVLPVDGGRLVR